MTNRTSSFLAFAVALTGTTAFAQMGLKASKVTAPIKDRGTYHVATGTWSRASVASSFNASVLFNNTAPSGYFFETDSTFNSVDHGRVPSDSSPASPTSVQGIASSYQITCFDLAYCSSIPAAAGGVTFELTFYDDYGPCTDISAPAVQSVADFVSTGLAGGTPGSNQGCWTASFDLSNTTLPFTLEADADGQFDDLQNMDSFGWALRFPQANATNETGPLISGNCPIGSVQGNPTTPQQGFGTAFGGVPGATDATGLGTNDFFWVDAAGLVPNANGGCFFFGSMGNGCADPSILPVGGNPYASFWLRLYGDDGDVPLPIQPFCTSAVNSTGSAATLSGSGSDVNADVVLTSTPVPNTTGQFFYGPMALTLAGGLGDGFRCVGGMTTRLLPFINTGMMMQPANTAVFTFNYTAPYASGFTGIKHFQHWFRDTTPGGSNSSTGITITF